MTASQCAVGALVKQQHFESFVFEGGEPPLGCGHPTIQMSYSSNTDETYITIERSTWLLHTAETEAQ